MSDPHPSTKPVEAVVERLRVASSPTVLAEMGPRYGIHTDRALGVSMADMKRIAKPLGRDHGLALGLWATGWYEARVVASLVDDPAAVTSAQMDQWCDDLDNWAIVDTVCFNLFDRASPAWEKVEPWASDDREMVKRAGFALLWALALHDNAAPDQRFVAGIALVETYAHDTRPLVGKAATMALRAIGARQPSLRPAVIDAAARLAASGDRASGRVGRSVLAKLADKERRQ